MEVFEKIVGERVRYSTIDNKMNVERFADLQAEIDEFKKTLKDEKLQEIFEKCFFMALN